jgi:hypothetical protein
MFAATSSSLLKPTHPLAELFFILKSHHEKDPILEQKEQKKTIAVA